jgi:flagellar hook-length control protein FliK
VSVLSSTAAVSALPAPAPAADNHAADPSSEGDSFAQALTEATPPKPAAKASPARAKPRGSESTENPRARTDGSAAERAPGAESNADSRPLDNTDGAEEGPPCADEVCSFLADMQALHHRTAVPATAAAGKEAPAEAPLSASAPKPQALPPQPLRPAAVDSAAAKVHTITPAAERESRSESVAPLATERSGLRAEATLPPTPQLAPGSTAAPAAQSAAPAQHAEGTLSAAPNSAEFAPQFAATISTFVRDGIEHAKLHLNPAEMGPVNVQIQIEGHNAQVLMSAEQAPTRQALEQSLPLLASSLREAGLTLSGGGVFEQHRNGSSEQGSRDNRHSTPRRAQPEPEPNRRLPTQRRGVVDLIA